MSIERSQLCPGWLHQRELQPDRSGVPALQLLARTAELPGTFRLAALSAGQVELLGEVREGSDPTSGKGDGIEEDVLVGALESSGLTYKRREPGWVVPAGGQRLFEVVLIPGDGGLRIESVLASWDEIGATEQEALARFLCRAQAGLRFVRCELDQSRVVVAANLALAEVESGLPHAVAAVVAAGRLLGREVAGLLAKELAEGYLQFFVREGEIPVAASRI